MSFTDKQLLAAQPRLLRFCKAMTRSDEAGDDLCQTTLLKALEQRRRFESGDDLNGWLLTIARNNFYSTHRKDKNLAYVEPENLAHLGGHTQDNPESILELRDVMRRINMLPDTYREILSYVETDYATAAEELGVAVGTVKSRLHKARAQLHKLLEEPFNKAATAATETPSVAPEKPASAPALALHP